jgi:hypothetical protein
MTDYLAPPGADKTRLPFYIPFLAGGMAGTSYWIFNYPVDYVKTLMQTDKLGNPQFKSTLDCFSQKYK